VMVIPSALSFLYQRTAPIIKWTGAVVKLGLYLFQLDPQLIQLLGIHSRGCIGH
jgi:hypothetical protein